MNISAETLKRRDRDSFDAGFAAGAGVARINAEMLRVLKVALDQTGCDGDLCMYTWHEDARRVIAEIEG